MGFKKTLQNMASKDWDGPGEKAGKVFKKGVETLVEATEPGRKGFKAAARMAGKIASHSPVGQAFKKSPAGRVINAPASSPAGKLVKGPKAAAKKFASNPAKGIAGALKASPHYKMAKGVDDAFDKFTSPTVEKKTKQGPVPAHKPKTMKSSRAKKSKAGAGGGFS